MRFGTVLQMDREISKEEWVQHFQDQQKGLMTPKDFYVVKKEQSKASSGNAVHLSAKEPDRKRVRKTSPHRKYVL